MAWKSVAMFSDAILSFFMLCLYHRYNPTYCYHRVFHDSTDSAYYDINHWIFCGINNDKMASENMATDLQISALCPPLDVILITIAKREDGHLFFVYI